MLPYFPLRQAWDVTTGRRPGVLIGWLVAWAASILLAVIGGIWGAVVGFQAGADAGLTGETVTVDFPAALVALQWLRLAVWAAAGGLFLAVVQAFEPRRAPAGPRSAPQA